MLKKLKRLQTKLPEFLPEPKIQLKVKIKAGTKTLSKNSTYE
ncbi:unnamed protein product [marine sediment metagenome]|uniref:Uncharacterized protein n=1 Tax=marine sediment metagenome TaxID=412755 RepID=X1P025_9ZZZZ